MLRRICVFLNVLSVSLMCLSFVGCSHRNNEEQIAKDIAASIVDGMVNSDIEFIINLFSPKAICESADIGEETKRLVELSDKKCEIQQGKVILVSTEYGAEAYKQLSAKYILTIDNGYYVMYFDYCYYNPSKPERIGLKNIVIAEIDGNVKIPESIMDFTAEKSLQYGVFFYEDRECED